jgi:hypothetical protein
MGARKREPGLKSAAGGKGGGLRDCVDVIEEESMREEDLYNRSSSRELSFDSLVADRGPLELLRDLDRNPV